MQSEAHPAGAEFYNNHAVLKQHHSSGQLLQHTVQLGDAIVKRANQAHMIATEGMMAEKIGGYSGAPVKISKNPQNMGLVGKPT